MNPYEPATELDDAIALEKPRKTTKAFRRTLWGLSVFFVLYVVCKLSIDQLRENGYGYYFFNDHPITDWLYHLLLK